MIKRINTMEEFSVLAGVSRPTASKYFDNPNKVSLRSRGKIESALSKVDYQPSLLASNLMRKSSNIIGVLIPSLGDPFYAYIVEHIERFALQYGYMVMIECSYGDSDLEVKAIDNFLSVKASGICYAPVGLKSVNPKLQHLEKDLPVVFIDAIFEGIENYVKNNNYQSIDLITGYITDTGRFPVYFPVSDINSNSQERLEAYQQSMTSRNLQPHVLPVNLDVPT
ncbi:MAG: LacI family DNA-binding transcriptional regulator [Ostreibacterium sp.]